jgi:cell division protein FtsL
MVRHSRKNRRGGDKIDDIQSQLDNIQQEVNELKSRSSSSMPESMPSESMPSESMPGESMQEESMQEESMPVNKPWQDNKDIKFADGNRGRVTLSFPRIMMLLDKNINSGNTTKNWSSIKDQLLDATSTEEVKNIIKTSGMNFSGNSVSGGTRKKRRGGRKRTSKRH